MSMTRRDVATALGGAVAAGIVFRTGSAAADCPNIQSAIGELAKVQTYLQNASHDFDGHKGDALGAVNEALKQLGLCGRAERCR